MAIKFNLTLTLLLAWLGLILLAGTVSGLMAWKLGKKSLSKVDKAEILQHQSIEVLPDVSNPKLVKESEILMKVINYVELQQLESETVIEASDAER